MPRIDEELDLRLILVSQMAPLFAKTTLGRNVEMEEKFREKRLISF